MSVQNRAVQTVEAAILSGLQCELRNRKNVKLDLKI